MERIPFTPYAQSETEKTEPHPEHEMGAQIVEALFDAGHEAYFIGGYCRDLMLGLHPKDVDIATSAQPETVAKVLEQSGFTVDVVEAAEAYPVVLAKQGENTIEVATFRKDVYHSPESAGRRPDEMHYGNIIDDAARRDLSINALYFNPLTNEMIDPTGTAVQDLQDKVIRFVGDPSQRILEDRVRMIRAVRFKNRLGFDYAPDTEEALRNAKDELKAIAAKDRIGDELTRIFLLPNRAEALEDLDKLGFLDILLPEYSQGHGVAQPPEHHSEGDVWTHCQMVVRGIPRHVDRELAWGTILHDIGKKDTQKLDPQTGKITFHGHDSVGADMAKTIARRYILQSKAHVDTDAVAWLVANHMRVRDLPIMSRSKQIALVTHPQFNNLLSLLESDNLSSVRPDGSTDNSSYFAALEIADSLREQNINKPPTIKEDFGIDGKLFIQRFRPTKDQMKFLGQLINHLNESYQDGHLKEPDEVLHEAVAWWEEHATK